MTDQKIDQLRHVVAFFMQEAETEARARESLENKNAELAQTMNRLGLQYNVTRASLDELMGRHFADWSPSDDTWLMDLVSRLEENLSQADRVSHMLDAADDLLRSVSQRITELWPEKTRGNRADDITSVLAMLKDFRDLERDTLKPKEVCCSSCEHSIKMHQEDGCWQGIGHARPNRDSVCPCGVKRSLLFSGVVEMESVPNEPRDGRDAILEHKVSGDADEEDIHSHLTTDPCEVWCIARCGCGDPACAHAPDGGNHPSAAAAWLPLPR